MLRHAAREFCSNTGLHGYLFLVIPKRVLLERVFWIIILIGSLSAALTVSLFAWKNTQGQLVQTVADSTHYPIWNYPFPTVTLCNFNKISKLKTYEMIKHIKKSSDIAAEDLAQDLRQLIQLILTDSVTVSEKRIIRLQNILNQNNITAHHMLQKLTPNCTETLQRCKWKGEERRCDGLFEQIKTSLGFCCSFNYYAPKNHRFSGAMPHKTPKTPRRVSGCGYKTGLEVLIANKPEDYFATDIASHGFRVLIHYPFNFPDGSIQSLLLEMKSAAFIAVSPIITKCNSQTASLPIVDRNCLFPNEKQLHSFQYYTYHNCMAECRINIVVQLCGCIPFYLHNENETFISSLPGQGYGKHSLSKCNCLPDCTYCTYPFESSAGEFSRKYATNGLSIFGGVKISNQSLMRVFFNDLVATKHTKVLSFYWHTLFALFGGLLSLLTGFSFGTAFEFIYFFIIRPLIGTLKGNKATEISIKDMHTINEKNEIKIKHSSRSITTSPSTETPTKVVYFGKNTNLPFIN